MRVKLRLRALERGITLGIVFSMAGCSGAPQGDGQADDEQLGQTKQAFSLGQQFTVDANTQCVVDGLSLHCCPAGKVMVGINITNNQLFCRDLIQNTNGVYSRTPWTVADYWTQRNGMHACPLGYVMRGVHIDANVLYCSLVLQEQFEFVDSAGSDNWWGDAVCNLPGSSALFAMSGIRADQNSLTCAF